MSLSTALQIAQSSLNARQTESAVVSRNIAGANDPAYTSKYAKLTSVYTRSGQAGGVRVDGIGRATDGALLTNLLTATSIATARGTLVDGLNRLQSTIAEPELGLSPAAKLGAFATALQQYGENPDDTNFAQAVLDGAKDLATTLNEATAAVQQVRASADGDIAISVERINGLLGELEGLNNTVVKGSQQGIDITEALDARDQVLRSLSEEIGIRTLSGDNNDIVVYTDSGVTLFETTARGVTFAKTNTFTAATAGNTVHVDGVPVAGPGATMELASGRLAGLVELRDEAAVTYQAQLDEIARGLIAAFAESDQSGGGGADRPGLFTYPGAPAMPAAATLSSGLAAAIAVSPNADPKQGGDLDRLRDGGLSGDPDYVYNASGAAGYSDRIQELVGKLYAPAAFDPSAAIDPTGSLSDYAAASVSWLEQARKVATAEAERQAVVVTRTEEALSNTVGVNIDEEMQRLLDIERAYEAAAKLIAVIDEMLDTLFVAVR